MTPWVACHRADQSVPVWSSQAPAFELGKQLMSQTKHNGVVCCVIFRIAKHAAIEEQTRHQCILFELHCAKPPNKDEGLHKPLRLLFKEQFVHYPSN